MQYEDIKYYIIFFKISLSESSKDCAAIMACDEGDGYEDCMQFEPFDDTVPGWS